MGEFYLKSDKIFLEDRVFSGYVKINGKIIEDVTDKEPKDSCEIKDYTGKIIAPGYFDTHVHGYGGKDIMDCTREALLTISEGIVKNGVTSFLPTTLTDTVEKLNKACENIAKHKDECKGAKVMGIFLEGPFFSEEHKGAQNPAYMSDPDIEKLYGWIEKSNGLVNKIAIAPELKGASEFIKKANAKNVTVALGHSNATYEEAVSAVESGAKIFVHTYNGMSPLHHRNPGMVGAAFTTENTYSEVICDGHHVHPAAVKVIIKAKSPENTVLITDCMMAGGMPEGDYKLGDFDVVVKDGAARIENGSLAGSILKLSQAVKNVVSWDLVTKREAVNMASLIPARSMGLDDKIGSIARGKCADINILSDDLTVLETYVDGERK